MNHRGAFQPCPKCGNCQFFRRSEKVNDKVVSPAGCRTDGNPVFCEPQRKGGRGFWVCESYRSRRNGRKKTRRCKPWQAAYNN